MRARARVYMCARASERESVCVCRGNCKDWSMAKPTRGGRHCEQCWKDRGVWLIEGDASIEW